MGDILFYAVSVVVVFVGGVFLGDSHSPTVTKAITALKAAEQKAQDTLAKITNHKAS